MTQKASMTCNDEVGCKSQHLIYQSVSFWTGKGSSPESDDGSWFTKMFFVSILVVTAVSATLFGVFSYYFQNKRKMDELQALEMSDFSSEHGGMPSNIRVGDFSGSVGSQTATSRGPDTGDSFVDHVMNGLRSIGGVLASLGSSNVAHSSSSIGKFTPLQSSSSHSSSSEDAPYDPPPLAIGGQGFLGKLNSTSGNNYVEEDDEDDVTIHL